MCMRLPLCVYDLILVLLDFVCLVDWCECDVMRVRRYARATQEKFHRYDQPRLCFSIFIHISISLVSLMSELCALSTLLLLLLSRRGQPSQHSFHKQLSFVFIRDQFVQTVTTTTNNSCVHLNFPRLFMLKCKFILLSH